MFVRAIISLLFPLFVLGIQSPPGRAQEIVRQDDTLVVRATRIPTLSRHSSDAITVITREQIEQSGSLTVAELLRTVPGAEVRASGQAGGQTGLFLRGANSGHTLVLIDGVRVNSSFTGAYDFANLTVNRVERIEIIRGPQSLLFGSEAIGGVVNIVTGSGTADAGGRISASAGSHDSAGARASLNASGDRVGGTLTGLWTRTDNARPNNGYRATDVTFGGRWNASDRLSFDLKASVFDSRTGIPNDRFTNDPNDYGCTRNSFLALIMAASPRPGWDMRIVASHSRDRLEFAGHEPNPPWFSGDIETTTISRRSQIDLQNVLSLGDRHQLLLGATHENAPVDHESESGFGDADLDQTQKSTGEFLTYRLTLGRRFQANVGGRLDHHATFGNYSTWRAGQRLSISAGTTLRTNIGTGYRAPTLTDLYYPNFSNPDLAPEESLGWDAGIEQSFAESRLKIGVMYFHNGFKNLIVYSGQTFRPENINEATTGGLESFLEWCGSRRFTLRGSYTWLPVAEDTRSNQRLLRRPKHSGSLSGHSNLAGWLDINVRLLAVGASPDRDYSVFPVAEVDNKGYMRCDIGAVFGIQDRNDVIVRVNNLFAAAYEETFGFPAVGRMVQVEVATSF